jgi:hypothetical protein
MEVGDKIDSETAYQMIKKELKEVKRVRKQHKETNCEDC